MKREELRQQLREMVIYLLKGEYENDDEVIDSYTDTLMLGTEEYVQQARWISDEEIEQKFSQSPANRIHPDRFRCEGAKWMRDLIFNNNNNK